MLRFGYCCVSGGAYSIRVRTYCLVTLSFCICISQGWSNASNIALPPRITFSLARLETINDVHSTMTHIEIESPTLEIHSEWLLHVTVTIDQTACDLSFLEALPIGQIVSLALVRFPQEYNLDNLDRRTPTNENCLQHLCNFEQ